MNIFQQFLETIRKYDMIQKKDKVIVAVSGGPDSVCLLHLFMTFKSELDISLYAAHLDHMFRGRESEEDACFVKALCDRWGVPLFSDNINVPEYVKKSGLSPEDAARRVRYDFFERVKKQTGAQKVATGHNRNDHEETILMNIFRGAGLDGLMGIEPVRNCYIRPLIEIPREDIEKYLKHEEIPFRIDATNLTTDYFRNSIRLELMPLIRQKYCPHLGKSLRRLSEIAKRDLSFMEQETEKARANVIRYEPAKVIIDVKKFSKLHEAVKYRLTRLAVEKLTGDVKDFEARHAKLLVDFIERALPGSLLDLPKNLQGLKEYEHCIISKEVFDYPTDYYYILEVPGEINIQETGITLKAYIETYGEKTKINTAPTIACLDYDKINSNLVVRNRRPGDRFKPLGCIGFKKLKDFFIDEKIPKRKRNQIPIVEAGGNIIWVGGMRIDDRFKVTEETTRILVLVVQGL